MKLHADTFLSAKFDNDISTFFVDKPDKKFLLFKNLLGCIHSYSSPKFIWPTLELDWRTLLVKLHTDTFLSVKFDNDLSTFFVDKPDKKFLMFKNLQGWIHSQHNPHFIWTSPWLDWRTFFVKLHTDTFFSSEFDNDISSFFVDKPDQKFLRFNNLLDCIHSHSSPHFIWTSHGLDWRTHFVKLHTDTFLSAQFDNDMSTLFVDDLDQKFLLFKNLLRCVHSYSSPHFIWTSSWLDGRTHFVKLHTDTFLSAKFDNYMSSFFVDEPDQKFLLFKNLQGCIHSQSSPHFIWTSPGQDWRTLFVKPPTYPFLSAKFDNDISTFFVDRPHRKFLLFKNLLGCIDSHSSLHFSWTSHGLGWKKTFPETANRHFFERKI